jgi:beta-galactosidase
MLWGVDYYPEQWDQGRWEADAERMRAFGFTAVRIMEFAWALVEPREGEYDFSLFQRVMDLLWKRGISVVIGTPTAAVPAWLYAQDPGMLQIHPSRMTRDWGTRRECCFNNGRYREAAMALVQAIGRVFGQDQRVLGFQVDNEPGHEGSDRCVCPACAREWPRWLERRYGTVDALGKAWGSVFWGRTLSSFADAPLPRAQVASVQNPHLILDYDRFSSDSAVSFIQAQARILKASAPGKWVTTNLFPPPVSHAIDMEELCRGMDFPSFDNYPVWGDQDEPMPYVSPAVLLEWTRGIGGGRAFCVMEQYAGQQGHACLGHLPDERRLALWTNQAVARGADKVFYFRWRTAPFGQEQLCLGLFDNDDTDTARARALRENMARLGPVFERLSPERPARPAALVYDKDSARMLREQYLSLGMHMPVSGFAQVGYDVELARQVAPLVAFNAGFDIVSAKSLLGDSAAGLGRYRLICLPLYHMADPSLAAALEAWVAEGGILVLSWRTGARDLEDHSPPYPIPGPFRELAGLKVSRFESLNRTSVRLRLRGVPPLVPAKGEVWAEILELEGARAEAWYAQRGKHYRGQPAVASHDFGKGRVWYFGTSPDPLTIFFLYKRILMQAGLKPLYLGQGVELAERDTLDGSRISFLMNHNPRPHWAMGQRLPAWGTLLIEKGRRIS